MYLTTAREHPASRTIRQRREDIARLMHATRDLGDRQSRVFLLLAKFLAAYQPPELQTLVDDDVRQSAGALAATLETAARGVIYEHRPESLAAGRLLMAIKPVLAEADQPHTSAFDRDAAVVLRRFEDLARVDPEGPPNPRAAIELLGRMVARIDETAPPSEATATEPPRLIVP